MDNEKVTIIVDKSLLDDANKVFEKSGISTEDAINMFLEECVREEEIPFELTNKEAALVKKRFAVNFNSFLDDGK